MIFSPNLGVMNWRQIIGLVLLLMLLVAGGWWYAAGQPIPGDQTTVTIESGQ